ncbi:hypothetical protein D3C87_1226170 [compost metagenome]
MEGGGKRSGFSQKPYLAFGIAGFLGDLAEIRGDLFNNVDVRRRLVRTRFRFGHWTLNKGGIWSVYLRFGTELSKKSADRGKSDGRVHYAPVARDRFVVKFKAVFWRYGGCHVRQSQNKFIFHCLFSSCCF